MNNKIRLQSAAIAATTLIGTAMAQAITIDTVPVGNIGNAPDMNTFGAVGYAYNIGKYEVTNAQYAAFLNAKAATDTFSPYNTAMAGQLGGIMRTGSSGSYIYAAKSGFENKPVNYVSFWAAARFSNWLNNGQGSGSTETGSYTLGSVTNPAITAATRNAGANWVVASSNEWYKAAYYDPAKNSGVGGYWLFPTQSDTLGDNTAFSATNGANYDDGNYTNGGWSGPGTTDAGTYVNASSYYGTFDQGGNLAEWVDEVIGGAYIRHRGGNWSWGDYNVSSSSGNHDDATNGTYHIGFRVASLAPIPEPRTYGAAMGVMALGVVMLRRRKARLINGLTQGEAS